MINLDTMCFSSGVSFGTGVVLSVIGIATLKKVKHQNQYTFAGIPMIFAIQQISEGFVWLALTDSDYAEWQQHIPIYLFLFFAQVLWPIWVPLAITSLEQDQRRKTFGKILVFIGAIVSLYLAYGLLTQPINAKIVGQHITYFQNYPGMIYRYGSILYFMVTILPPFLSSHKKMWILGLSILISYIITIIFFENHIISVWCFFASVISILVYFILNNINKKEKSFL